MGPWRQRLAVRPPRRIWRAAAAAAALALLLPAAVVPARGTSSRPPAQPSLVDDQLVLAQLDAGGLPTEVAVVTRISATDLDEQVLRVPTSTTDLRYLDRPGSPPVSGDAMLVPVGGPGQSTVVTQATFDRPLPVALHAEYTRDGAVVDPATVPGESGALRVRYTVTNTEVEKERIRYTDAAGGEYSREVPVFAPFAGTLVVTLPPGTRLVSAPGATVASTSDGRAQVRWELVLYPPVGDYRAVVDLDVASDDLRIPGLRLEVLPVTDAEDPAAGFATDLLDGSVSGSADLADGLRDIDESTVRLAAGAAALTRGLEQLQAGTAALDAAVSDQLVPASDALAAAAGRLADGQQDLAAGVASAYTGATGLSQGTTSLTVALRQLDAGLAGLAGSDGLPGARDAARRLTLAVDQLSDAVGSPEDPAPRWAPEDGEPPPSALTLVQTTRAVAAATGALAGSAASLGADLADLLAPASSAATSAAGAAADAGAAATLVGSVASSACGPSPVLGPADCAALAQAGTRAGAAASGAADAARDAGTVATGLAAAARRAQGVAVGAGALARAMQGIAAAVTGVADALRSRDTADPGLYEGMTELTTGLRAAADAAVALSHGAEQSVEGARRLSGGTGDLTTGLGRAADGSSALAAGGEKLAGGAAQTADGVREVARAVGGVDDGLTDAASGGADLADGATRLHREGTSAALDGVVSSSRKPARAQAYLGATADAVARAAPYAAPEGGVARVAYVSVLEPPEPVSGPGVAVTVLAILVAASLVVLAVRRIVA